MERGHGRTSIHGKLGLPHGGECLHSESQADGTLSPNPFQLFYEVKPKKRAAEDGVVPMEIDDVGGQVRWIGEKEQARAWWLRLAVVGP